MSSVTCPTSHWSVAESPAAARFDGLHFDIEPYLLLSWRYPRSREQLLRELLENRNEATLRRVREGLVELSEDVHSLAYQLHPSVLEELGLLPAWRRRAPPRP